MTLSNWIYLNPIKAKFEFCQSAHIFGKQPVFCRTMIFTVPFICGGNKRVQNISLAYEYYLNFTFHWQRIDVCARDIVNLLICLTFVNKCFSTWYVLCPCSFFTYTNICFIPKEHIVIHWWIGFRWFACEIHPHISTTIVLCCIPFQSDIIWLNWRSNLWNITLI